MPGPFDNLENENAIPDTAGAAVPNTGMRQSPATIGRLGGVAGGLVSGASQGLAAPITSNDDQSLGYIGGQLLGTGLTWNALRRVAGFAAERAALPALTAALGEGAAASIVGSPIFGIAVMLASLGGVDMAGRLMDHYFRGAPVQTRQAMQNGAVTGGAAMAAYMASKLPPGVGGRWGTMLRGAGKLFSLEPQLSKSPAEMARGLIMGKMGRETGRLSTKAIPAVTGGPYYGQSTHVPGSTITTPPPIRVRPGNLDLRAQRGQVRPEAATGAPGPEAPGGGVVGQVPNAPATQPVRAAATPAIDVEPAASVTKPNAVISEALNALKEDTGQAPRKAAPAKAVSKAAPAKASPQTGAILAAPTPGPLTQHQAFLMFQKNPTLLKDYLRAKFPKNFPGPIPKNTPFEHIWAAMQQVPGATRVDETLPKRGRPRKGTSAPASSLPAEQGTTPTRAARPAPLTPEQKAARAAEASAKVEKARAEAAKRNPMVPKNLPEPKVKPVEAPPEETTGVSISRYRPQSVEKMMKDKEIHAAVQNLAKDVVTNRAVPGGAFATFVTRMNTLGQGNAIKMLLTVISQAPADRKADLVKGFMQLMVRANREPLLRAALAKQGIKSTADLMKLYQEAAIP